MTNSLKMFAITLTNLYDFQQFVLLHNVYLKLIFGRKCMKLGGVTIEGKISIRHFSFFCKRNRNQVLNKFAQLLPEVCSNVHSTPFLRQFCGYLYEIKKKKRQASFAF